MRTVLQLQSYCYALAVNYSSDLKAIAKKKKGKKQHESVGEKNHDLATYTCVV